MKNHQAIITLLVVAVLVGGSQLNAQWSNPSVAPTGGNVPAPVNVGSDAQIKSGSLSVGGLLVEGDAQLTDQSPTIKFEDNDSGHMDWWQHINNNRMYFIADRNDDGSWSGEQQWPLYLQAGATDATDAAIFSNQVRAREFCDRLANNCFTSTDVTSGNGSIWEYSGSQAHPGNGNSITFNTGFGSAPSEVQVDLVNVVAEGGYNPGDVIYDVGSATGLYSDRWHDIGVVTYAENNGTVVVRVSPRGMGIVTKSGGYEIRLNSNNWEFVVKANEGSVY